MFLMLNRIHRQCFSWLLICVFGCGQISLAFAQQSQLPGTGNTTGATSGITLKICAPPPVCFASKADRETWANEHQCKFLEDVCEKTPASEDNKGAKAEDQGFWGQLWGGITTGLKYGYEFGKGLFEGLKSQITGLIDLISNPLDVVKGLIDLGKAFYNDPKGTLKALAELLGQEAIDTINRATQCGAYDLGKVIGSYVSPAVMLKLATKLTKFGGKLSDAVKATKHDLGCASFVAGTPVLTPQGLSPIEQILQSSQVSSRDDRLWSEAAQTVNETFSRTAPGYRELKTEQETFYLTDEHPLWVQGKGWTKAQEITDEDVLSSLSGDVLVKSNLAIAKPVKVYNFSVNKTPSYFVGSSGLWAHNAKCDIKMPYQSPKSPSGYKIGATDGHGGQWTSINRPDDARYKYQRQVTGAPANVEYRINGVNFDGYDAKRGVLIDAKNATELNPLVKGEPQFLVDKFKAQAVADAKNQVLNSNGAKVEWHVSNEKAANELRALFDADPSLQNKIAVVFTQDIVNP